MTYEAIPRDRSAGRRLITVPAMIVGTIGLGLIVLPLWVLRPITDRLGRTVAGIVRGLLFLHQVMLYEMGGLLVCGALWLTGRADDMPPHWSLQRWWGQGIFQAAIRRFRMQVTVEGEDRLPTSGPYLVLVRHSSQVDTLLPAALFCHGRHWRLRWVLKSELLWQPCLDIAGNRLPNLFAQRNANRRDLRGIRSLARDLGEDEGVLIYPEGTRFSPDKRRKVLESLDKRSDELRDWARSLENVLPPRLGGTLTLLRDVPSAKVVVVAHRGLEVAGTLGGVVLGRLLDAHLEIRLQSFEAAAVPRERQAAETWLRDIWSDIDRWVGEGSEKD